MTVHASDSTLSNRQLEQTWSLISTLLKREDRGSRRSITCKLLPLALLSQLFKTRISPGWVQPDPRTLLFRRSPRLSEIRPTSKMEVKSPPEWLPRRPAKTCSRTIARRPPWRPARITLVPSRTPAVPTRRRLTPFQATLPPTRRHPLSPRLSEERR